MTKQRVYGTRGESARGRSPRDLTESMNALDQRVSTVITVVRRLGFVLQKAHELCEQDMLRGGFHETAEVLRDELKPLIDALIHFDVSRETVTGGSDGDTEV